MLPKAPGRLNAIESLTADVPAGAAWWPTIRELLFAPERRWLMSMTVPDVVVTNR